MKARALPLAWRRLRRGRRSGELAILAVAVAISLFGLNSGAALATVVGVLVTFHIVCLGWILFRAETFELAWAMIEGLGRMAPLAVTTPFMLGLIVIGLGMHWLPPRAAEGLALRLKAAPSLTLGLLIGAAFLLVEAMRPDGVAPFIYFQF